MSFRRLQSLGGRGNDDHQWSKNLIGLAASDDGVWTLGDAAVKHFNLDGELTVSFKLEHAAWGLALDEENERLWIGFEGAVGCYSYAGQSVGGFADEPRLGRVTAIRRVGDALVVGDANGRCVRVYDLEGRWLRDVANNNRTAGLLIPNGVVDFDVDRRSDTIVVANPAKHRVERYALDGEFLGFWGYFSMHDDAGFPGCCNPTNLAVGDDGNIFVTEKAPPRLKSYTCHGDLLSVTPAGEFDPQAKNMALDVRGSRVYVADTAQLSVRVFDWTADEQPAATLLEPAAGAAP